MAEALGHTLPLTLARRVTCDFLHVSMSVPAVTIQMEMNISDLVAARRIVQPRPSWSSIFTKAYGKVVAARPDLRRAIRTASWGRTT